MGVGEGALGPLETLMALRGLAWSGGRMEPCRWPERGDDTGASDGGQESHMAWGQPGISHSRKTLVTHPWSWRVRSITPEHQNQGCWSRDQERDPIQSCPPSALLSLVTVYGPSALARQKKATCSGLTPRPMQISAPKGPIGSGWG